MSNKGFVHIPLALVILIIASGFFIFKNLALDEAQPTPDKGFLNFLNRGVNSPSPSSSQNPTYSQKPSPKASTSSSPSPSASTSPSPTSTVKPSPQAGVYKLDLGNENINVPKGRTYSMAARLTDSNGTTIKDQSGFNFEWTLENTVPNHSDYTCFGSLKVLSEGNHFGNEIDSPLPNNYAQFWAHSEKPVSSCPDNLIGGNSTINIKVIKKSDASTVATGKITATITN